MTGLEAQPVPREKEPLYLKLERDLRSRIQGNDFAPSGLLPTEDQFCAEYGVSRITVRRALGTLEAQGLIQRRRGVGTFVSVPKATTRAMHMTASFDQFIAAAGDMCLRVLTQCERVASREVREALNLGVDETVMHLEVVSLVENDPVAYFDIYLPSPVALIIAEDLEAGEVMGRTPIMRIIEQRTGVRINRVKQRIEPAFAGRKAAHQLGLDVETPVLRVVRTYYSVSGQPMEMVAVHYHPSRYQYVTDFR